MIPGLLGFLVGAVLYGATYQNVFPSISKIVNLGSAILPSVFDVNLWLVILLFVLITLTLFYFLERHGELRKDKAA